MKHLRRDGRGRNARGKRRRRRRYSRESPTPCAVWRSCSNPWVAQKTTREGPHGGVEAEAPHHPGVTVLDHDALSPLNRIPLVHAGEVQVDPGPRGGGRNPYGSREETSVDVPDPTALRTPEGLCYVITGTEVHTGSGVYLNLFKLSRTSLPQMLTEKPFSLLLVNSCLPIPHKSTYRSIWCGSALVRVSRLGVWSPGNRDPAHYVLVPPRDGSISTIRPMRDSCGAERSTWYLNNHSFGCTHATRISRCLISI